MTWTKIYGPEQFDVCGDDALYEIGSVYGVGAPDAEGRCSSEAEIVYYVIFTAGHPASSDDTWGVMQMTHIYNRDGEGEVIDGVGEEYEYEWGSPLCYWSYDGAKRAADDLANADDSWLFDFQESLDSIASEG